MENGENAENEISPYKFEGKHSFQQSFCDFFNAPPDENDLVESIIVSEKEKEVIIDDKLANSMYNQTDFQKIM